MAKRPLLLHASPCPCGPFYAFARTTSSTPSQSAHSTHMAAVVGRFRRSKSFADVLVVRGRKQYCKQSQYVVLAFGGRNSG